MSIAKRLRTISIVGLLKGRLLKLRLPFVANTNISSVFWANPDEQERSLVLIELQAELEKRIQAVLDCLLIDTKNDHNTQETAKRVAKMYLHEVFRGRFYPLSEDLTTFPNSKNLDEMMVYGPCEVKSTCSHHFLPFIGSAWVGVLGDKTLAGLSKYNRIVDHYSRRPQIQEELTVQIADDIERRLKPKGLIVVIKAKHYCVYCRGVEQESGAATSVARGVFKDNASSKQEFFNLLNLKI